MNLTRLLGSAAISLIFLLPTASQACGLCGLPEIEGFDDIAYLEGEAGVVDGNGIIFGDQIEVRLNGIAAPESGADEVATGGPESTAHLKKLVEGKIVTCLLDGMMNGPRLIGICFVEGKDLGELQVKNGHARDCSKLSKGRYAEAESWAKQNTRDLSSTYELPPFC